MTRRAWALDIAVAAVVAGFGQVEVWNGAGATHEQGPQWAQACTYALLAVCVAVRRVRPLAALVAATVVCLAEFASFGSPEGFAIALSPTILAYTVGRWEVRRPSWWGLVAVAALGVGWVVLDPVQEGTMMRLAGAAWTSPWVIAWLVGALIRNQVQAAEQRRLRRSENASRAVAEERNRIARELHDVLGHSVSVMTVQASAVRRRLTSEQAAEREALESVETVGREALAEMRRIVTVLRHVDDPSLREPPAGLANVSSLLEQFRIAGLPVHLTITGEPRSLTPGLDLTAYRLIQEGLTNTFRHASAPRGAEVSIGYAHDRLEVSVVDEAEAVSPSLQPGHGLLGMRERVAMFGGHLVARPRTAGGFELLASLPLEPA